MVDFFRKRPRVTSPGIVLLRENARHHTLNWTYICLWLYIQILCSVFYLSLHTWEVPDWQVTVIDADVRHVITSWLQTLDSSAFTLGYKPWYHCGANAKMIVMTMLRSDVYHLLHMCHVLINVIITFWHESVCYLIFFLISWCIYIAFWAGEFINTGYSEWWALCVICWYFYNELRVLAVAFTLLCPHNFVTCLT